MDLTRVKESTSSNDSKVAPATHHKKRLGVIAVIITVAALVIASIFAAGYYYGQSVAEKKQKKPENLLSQLGDSLSLAAPATGSVDKVDRMSITIIGSDNQPKTFSLTESTRVTHQNTTLTLSDVKKGQNVTVFTTGNEKNLTVTRIIVR